MILQSQVLKAIYVVIIARWFETVIPCKKKSFGDWSRVNPFSTHGNGLEYHTACVSFDSTQFYVLRTSPAAMRMIWMSLRLSMTCRPSTRCPSWVPDAHRPANMWRLSARRIGCSAWRACSWTLGTRCKLLVLFPNHVKIISWLWQKRWKMQKMLLPIPSSPLLRPRVSSPTMWLGYGSIRWYWKHSWVYIYIYIFFFKYGIF